MVDIWLSSERVLPFLLSLSQSFGRQSLLVAYYRFDTLSASAVSVVCSAIHASCSATFCVPLQHAGAMQELNKVATVEG